MVVMRLIWAAGKKSDLALPMRAQHSDHRVAHLYRGCCKGFPGWEGVSGRWSDPKRRGKPPAVGAPESGNGRGVIRAGVRLRAAPLWWKSGVCPQTAGYYRTRSITAGGHDCIFNSITLYISIYDRRIRRHPAERTLLHQIKKDMRCCYSSCLLHG